MSLGEDDTQNSYLLQKAIGLGINFFDTADLYGKGQNELSIGRALKEKRKNIILASKAGNQWRADGSGWDWNPRKEYILACAEGSLKRLQTDYIDLYQLHGGTIDDPIDETIEAFELLLQQGKIRHYGISSIRPNTIREYIRRSHIVSVMMQYSLLDRRPEETCLELLYNHHLGVLARGSLATGLLVSKTPATYLNYPKESVETAARGIAELSAVQRSKTATALQYVLSQPAISAAVVGIRTEEQLLAAVAATNAAPLSNSEKAMLNGLIPVNHYELHR
jgi:aryl-alcohol dehydrogenase-like predicted oxidoreductase